MAGRGWKPFKFQREVWQAIDQGRSGLLHATTGAGKTYAVWLGALMSFVALAPVPRAQAAIKKVAKPKKPVAPPLTVLWITPMRALAADTLRALQQPLEVLNAARNDDDDGTPRFAFWSAGTRSGDTPAAERNAQNKRLPTVLITTPESLSLLLARADARDTLGSVKLVVVDEWHELLGNKRGVQVQLALARLKTWRESAQDEVASAGPPQARLTPSGDSEPRAVGSVRALIIWGMSATLGNLPEALHTLLGNDEGMLVKGKVPKKLRIDTLLPERAERFPWAGHLGLSMLPQVIEEIDASTTTLVFTNTRSQAELWYQAMLQARPDWAGVLALHHGSLDRAVRDWVESGLKNGSLKAVICTSTLDLGVDFLPVERVLQIGSPKGVARLLQRAGRSGHAPGRPSRITLVPTHSLEIVEAAAVREAVAAGHVEARSPPVQPLDVLVQHLVTVALGGGFTPDALYDEVRRTAAYAQLPQGSWDWCLSFVSQGGPSLAVYPDYRRVAPDEQGMWRVPDARLARRHRANIGTIVSDASMAVQYVGGARLGTVEESFAARLKPGDCFLFGGQLLALVRIHDMTAWVRRAKGKRAAVPRWRGARQALSSALADAVLHQLTLAESSRFETPELRCARPLLELQQRWSALPTPQTLLAEALTTREGWHVFVYPFAGRQVHLGLASLLAWRLAQRQPHTFSIAVNDYGFELLSATEVDWPALLPQLLRAPPGSLATASLADAHSALRQEVLASLNATELAQRRFREIARVAGLIFQSHPGEKRGNKQLQASSSLFYKVFRKYDPGNLLLLQAGQELLAQELDISRLHDTLACMQARQLVMKKLTQPTPFAFPLMVERLREQLSTESMAERIARMVALLERAAVAPVASKRRALAQPNAEAEIEKTRLSLAFSQDTLTRPATPGGNTRSSRTVRTPRSASGRRRPGA
ncbi:MAG: ligase-associated DNA damage response DEXH box helicase [Polaromonas sp.]